MFHRPRPEIQTHPDHASAGVSAGVSLAAPGPDSGVASAAPFFQPEPTKESEPMSTFTTPNMNANEPHAPEASAPAARSEIPGSSSYMAPRAPIAAGAPRSPYMPYNPYAASAGAPEATQSVSTGRKLVLGEGITMSGEIEACDHLVVEGTVEASLKGASVLDVSQTGMFYGTVEISEATIAGRFEGELTVNGRLTIRSTGSVVGTIAYKELAVEAGAVIDGKINPMRDGMGAGKAPLISEKKPLAPRAVKVEGASQDLVNELPFSQKTVVAAE